ncbi:UNVERIFIED_CONTAM: hypothetical protein H355_005521 [Colinus virginianus]|nr:hypothetical protein H355_005521 [Colinus virginianus]
MFPKLPQLDRLLTLRFVVRPSVRAAANVVSASRCNVDLPFFDLSFPLRRLTSISCTAVRTFRPSVCEVRIVVVQTGESLTVALLPSYVLRLVLAMNTKSERSVATGVGGEPVGRPTSYYDPEIGVAAATRAAEQELDEKFYTREIRQGFINTYVCASTLWRASQTAARRYPLNYALLLLFTCCESVLLASVTCYYNEYTVFIALVATVMLTVGLSVFAFQVKYDFTSWVGVLFLLTLNLLLFGFFCLLLPKWAQVLYASLALLLFSVYLVVDTQLIVGRGKLRLSEDDYIVAALMLYVDIITIFLQLLRIVAAATDNN